MTNAKSSMRLPPGRRQYDPGIDPKESTCRATRKVPMARLCAVLALLMIALTIFLPTSTSSSAASSPSGKSSQTQFAALHHRRSSSKVLKKSEVGLLEKIMRPVGLPENRFLNLFLPQAPPPTETLATFAEDCTTPKTDFNFGDTICVVVTNAPSGGGNQRLFWGHTDGFLARETSLTSSSQSDSFVLTPTSVIAGLTLDNKGTWRIFSVDAEGAPFADTSFTIHDPATLTADLTVFKFPTAGSNVVNEDTDVDFTIVVGNNGPDAAANVHLADAVPDVATFVSLTQDSGPAFTCGDPSDSDCTIASLAKGAQATFTARYHTNGVLNETLSTYSATVSSDTAELHTQDNTAEDDFTVAATAAGGACTLLCPDNVNAVANTTEGGVRGVHVTFASAEPSGDCGAVTNSPASGSFFPVGTTTVNVTSETGGGSCSFTVTVTDTGTNPPTISCPASVQANADSSCQATVTVGNPTTSGDNVTVVGTRSDGKSLYACDANGNNCTRKTTDDPFSVGINTITWTAYSHNSAGPFATPEDEEAARTGSTSCTQAITVNDVTPPNISVSPQTIAADANCMAVVPDFTTSASVTDNCACSSSDNSESCVGREPITVTQSPAPGTPVGLGTHTITLTANDGSSNNGGAGNTATTQTTLTVADQTAPVISCPANIEVFLPLNTPDTSMGVTFPNATATDNCSTPTITYSKASGSVFQVGSTTVTATATDAAGNHSSCSFTVTVRYNFTGFFSPVGNPPILNSVVAGRAIPVKFSLSGDKGLNIFAAGNPYTVSFNCNSNDPGVDVTETVNAGGSSLSFGGDQYTYVWKTQNSWVGTCRQLIITLNDGSVHTANFKFK